MRTPFGRLRSFTWQILLTVTLLQLAAAGLLLGFLQWQNRNQVQMMQREAVAHRLNDLTALYRLQGSVQLARTINAAVGEFTSDEVIQLRAADGHVLAGNIAGLPNISAMGGAMNSIVVRRIGNAANERALATLSIFPSGERLLIGSVVEDDFRLISRLTQGTIVALCLAVPLALVAATMIARQIDRRLRSLTTTASIVRQGDLSRRVPRDASQDAFDDLAAAMNAMLDQVDGLVSELRLVTESLAHDLRSPLSRIRARIERAQSGDPDVEMAAVLSAIDHDLGFVLKTLSAMLQISRTEAGIGLDAKKLVDVDALLADMAEIFEPAAAEAGFKLVLGEPVRRAVPVHRSLVSQALANLIENAFTHASGGDRIDLGTRAVDGSLEIFVRDNGSGVAHGDLEKIKQRFVRLDAARSAAGSGLGLSLAVAVARRHGGRLDTRNLEPGLEVCLVLPLRSFELG